MKCFRIENVQKWETFTQWDQMKPLLSRVSLNQNASKYVDLTKFLLVYILGGCCGSRSKTTRVGGWAFAWWLVTDVQRLSLEVSLPILLQKLYQFSNTSATSSYIKYNRI